MTLPLVSAAAGDQGYRRHAGAALLLLLLVGFGPAARAQTDDPYTETVKVDAAADTAVNARERARVDGQRRALTAVADRLAGGPGKGKLPRLDNNAITDMVASFEVANERVSAVRYIADYTFHFRPAELQKVLKLAGISAPDAGGKPRVVLPVYQIGTKAVLWEDPNPWREAWAQRQAGTGPVRLAVPLGDASDIAAIDADKARGGDGEALTAIARNSGTDEVLVALAAVRGPSGQPAGLDIAIRRYRNGQLADDHTQLLDANPGESQRDFMRRAVDAIASAIDSGWKSLPAPSDQQGTLSVEIPITGLDDWLNLRQRLSGVPAIRKIDLRALSRQEAVIELAYIGNVEQLTASLGELGLELVRGDPMWRIARAGAASSQ